MCVPRKNGNTQHARMLMSERFAASTFCTLATDDSRRAVVVSRCKMLLCVESLRGGCCAWLLWRRMPTCPLPPCAHARPPTCAGTCAARFTSTSSLTVHPLFALCSFSVTLVCCLFFSIFLVCSPLVCCLMSPVEPQTSKSSFLLSSLLCSSVPISLFLSFALSLCLSLSHKNTRTRSLFHSFSLHLSHCVFDRGSPQCLLISSIHLSLSQTLTVPDFLSHFYFLSHNHSPSLFFTLAPR